MLCTFRPYRDCESAYRDGESSAYEVRSISLPASDAAGPTSERRSTDSAGLTIGNGCFVVTSVAKGQVKMHAHS